MSINEYDDMLDELSKNKVPDQNEYDDILDNKQTNDFADLKRSFNVANKEEPDKAASILSYAKKTNLPYDVVSRNLNVINNKLNKKSFTDSDIDYLKNESPKLANYLKDPYKAAATKDDLKSLMGIEKTLNRFKSADEETNFITDLYTAGKTGVTDFITSNYFLAASYGKIDKKTAAKAIKENTKKLDELLKNKPEYAVEFQRVLDSDIKDISVNWDRFKNSYREYKKRESLNSLIDVAVDGSKTIGEGLDAISIVATRPKGTAYTVVENFPYSIPALLSGAGGAAIGSYLGPAAGAKVGYLTGTFLGGAEAEMASWIRQAFINRKVDLYDEDAIISALNDKAFIGEIQAEALRKGVTTSGVDVLFSLINLFGGRAVKQVAKKGALQTAKELGKEIAIESVGEGLGEFAGQAAAKKDISKADLGEAVKEAIVSLGQSAGQVAISRTLTPATESLRGKYSEDVAEAASEATSDFLSASDNLSKIKAITDLNNQIKESKTAKRDAAIIADFVNENTAQSLYYQIDDWDEFWTLKGESPSDKAAELFGDNGEAYRSSKDNNTNLEVPISKFAEVMSNQELSNELAEKARFEPDGLSVEESKEIISKIKNTVTDLSREAVIEKKKLEEIKLEQKEVRAQLEENLTSIGRDKKEAILLSSFYNTVSERAGLTPKELAKRYELTIQKNTNIDETGFRVLKQDAKGQIRFGKDNKYTIELFEKADASTLVHETGHYFLEVMGDLAKSNKNINQDFSVILEYLGVGDIKDIKVEHHEKFAKSFEQYVKEGVAPSNKLKKAFNLFKAWLTNIYKTALDLNIKLSDDIREVFNRLLATDIEINQVKESLSDRPLFTKSFQDSMPKDLKEKYNKLIEDSTNYATEKLNSKLLKSLEAKERKFYKAKKSEIKSRLESEIKNSKVYNAISFLKTGVFENKENNTLITEMKLNKSELYALVTDSKERKKFRGMTDDVGVPIDHAAAMLGFNDRIELVDAIKKAPSKKDYINAVTELELAREFPEINDIEKQLSEDSLKEYHNDSRAERLKLELDYLVSNEFATYKKLQKRIAKKVISNSELKKVAKDQINKTRVKDLNPNQFKKAEAREANRALDLFNKGDFEGAFDAKQKQLLNHHLFNEAKTAFDQMNKVKLNFRNFFQSDKDLAKTRDLSFINTARAILERYGVGDPRKLSKKEPLEYLEPIKLYDQDMYKAVVALADNIMKVKKQFTDLNYADASDFNDSIMALWDLSRSSKTVELGGKKIDVQEASTELIANLDKFKSTKKNTEEYNRTKTDWEKTKKGLLGVKALLRRFESWIDTMDLGDFNGVFRKYLYQNVSDATDAYMAKSTEYAKRFRDLSKEIKFTQTPIESSELGFKFKNKAELLGALLHIGNNSNKRKLLLGYNWGSLNADNTLNTQKFDAFLDRMHKEGVLTKADYDYVQAIWDMMEEVKPMAQKAHKKIFGFYFDEITHNPFMTPFGEYKGGYAPAKVDPNVVTDIARRNELEEFVNQHSTYTYPAAGGKGFTFSRVEDYSKPLMLDISLFRKHMDDVLRFSIIKPSVVDTAKIVMNRDFRNEMDLVDSVVIEEMIKPALNRADKHSAQTVTGSGPGFLNKIRGALIQRSAMQIMFGNAVNTIEQYTGVLIGSLHNDKRATFKALYRYVKDSKNMTAEIASASTYMKNKLETQAFEIYNEVDKMVTEETPLQKMRDWAQRNAYILQTMTQNQVDSITWAASYDTAIESGMSHDQAVKKADSVVRLSQGSVRPMDISNVEANPYIKFFQMFMGYFNMLANLNTAEFTKLYYQDLGLSSKIRKGMIIYMFTFAGPAILSAALRRAAGGSLDEDDDGEYLDDMFDVLFTSQVRQATALVPVVGSAIQAGLNKMNDKVYDDRVSASPAINVISSLVAAPISVTKAVTQGRGEKAAVNDALTAVGVGLGIPLAPLSKPINYLIDVDKGKKRPENKADLIRGLVTGK